MKKVAAWNFASRFAINFEVSKSSGGLDVTLKFFKLKSSRRMNGDGFFDW
jgi:hypothetical protein